MTDRPYDHPRWSDPNGPTFGGIVALACAAILAGVIAVGILRDWLTP